MKKIMIDMDDVICSGGYLYHLNKFLGTNYKEGDITNYYLEGIVPKERACEWNDYIISQNVYADGNLFLPDAINTIELLSKVYEVYIVTAYVYKERPYSSGSHLYNKFECLCKNLSFLPPQNFVFCNNKNLIKCDIKIDDRLNNLSENADIKFLFDAYHNRDISEAELIKNGVIRVCTWRQIGALLLNN